MAFGGSIRLEGETEYKKALAGIMQTYKELQSELKLVTSQFDKNDKSQEALKAKAEAMNKLLEQQKTKLDLLNDRYAELNRLAEQQRSNIQTLTDKYRSEVSVLEDLERSVGKTSDEYKKQESIVRDLENQLDKETKANEQTETAMSKLRVEMNNTQTEANKTGREMDNLGNETEEAGKDAEKAASGGWTILNGVIANLATNAIQKAIEGVKTLASKLVDVGKQSYNAFAEYEQLVGGVETLYGESAKRLQEYAQNAYKTAGVSANKYMEQATSFAATLLQGLDGDTEKAVDYADMAIKDMADNANKMGTNLQSIQNAYQGFAKDNYTMLDNLKLGYGGTASEMARLVNEMKVLGVNEKGELLKEVNSETIKNVGMDKLIEAIHLAQQQLGITGTTAKEAEGTITGSMGQVAAAFENLKVAFATGDGGEVRGWVETLTLTLETMLKNAIPRIQNVIKGMWTGIKTALRQNLPGVANTIIPAITKIKDAITKLFDFIKKNGDTIIAIIKGVVAAFLTLKVASLIQSVVTALGSLVAMANPISILVTAVAGLVGLFVAMDSTTNKITNEEAARRAAIDETIDRINDNKEAWENLEQAQKDYADSELNKLDRYEALWNELKKITDENGKIKEGYEARAEFITKTLSEAYGIEIEIVDGVVQKYQELSETIGEVMRKQRAQVLVSSQQALYEDALKNQTKNAEELIKAEKLLVEQKEKEAELDAKMADYNAESAQLLEDMQNGVITTAEYQDKMVGLTAKYNISQLEKDQKAEQKRTEALQKAYDDQMEIVQKGLYYIGQYEQNAVLLQEGRYDEITTASWEFVRSMNATTDAELAILEHELEVKETLRKAELDAAKKYGEDLLESQIAQTDAEIEELQRRRGAHQAYIDDITSLYAGGISLPSLPSVGGAVGAGVNALAQAIQSALNGTKVEMDGEEMGIFVTNTITREVYSSVK